MFTDPRKIMFRVIGALVCASILIFIYSKYNRYITGPEIVSINIENHQTTETPSLFLQAEVTDTQSIFLNGRSLILQNKKNIEEIIVFSPGNNIIEIVLEDSFGKSREYVYHI
ncbi:MAG: hypothetical protein ACPGTS_01870, partial [Minisyncoccia bacterium]